MAGTVLLGLMIPFAGTALGAACVFVLRRSLRDGVQRALTGFAAGVMVAASVWSLLIPAMDQAAALGAWAFLPAAGGFWLGVGFLLLLDHLIPHLHRGSDCPEGPRCALGRSAMLTLAVTLHNIPEGMAVGAVYAGLLAENTPVTPAGAAPHSWPLTRKTPFSCSFMQIAPFISKNPAAGHSASFYRCIVHYHEYTRFGGPCQRNQLMSCGRLRKICLIK